jgi:DnaJ-class molecular chaperone
MHLCSRCNGSGMVKQERCPDCSLWRDAIARAEQRELDALAKLDEARAMLRRRHGMKCPTFDDNTKPCGGCEVSVFLGDTNAT